MNRNIVQFVAGTAALSTSSLALALGGVCGTNVPDVDMIASSKDGNAFVSIGAASINADGTRVVFTAQTALGDRLFLWTPGNAPDPIAAVTTLIDTLGPGPGDEVYLGSLTMQRAGDLIAFTTQLNQDAPRVWTLDLNAANPVEVAIGSPGAVFTAVGQLSIDDGGALSFWKLTCDRGGCLHEILESLDPDAPIVPGLPDVSVIAPVRTADGSSTVYLQHEDGVLSIQRTGVGAVYTATNDQSNFGILSVPAMNGAAAPKVAVYINDPIGSVSVPGIYLFDLANNAIDASDLAVRLDEAPNEGFELAPTLSVRPTLNDDGDLGFTAVDVTDADQLTKAFLRRDGVLKDLIAVCRDEIDGGDVVSDLEVIGVTNRDGLAVTVLFRAIVGSGGDTWTVLAATDVSGCPADLTGNASVGVADLLALLAAWGPCPAPCPADLTGDGFVGVADLLALLAAWGPCPN